MSLGAHAGLEELGRLYNEPLSLAGLPGPSEPSFLLVFGSAEQLVTVQQLCPGSAELFLFPHNQMLPSLILSEHLSNCGSFCETSVQEETKGSRDAVEMKALLYISNALTDFSFFFF